MKHRNRYTKAAERMTKVESLELEIERAWGLLGQKRGPCAVRLTRTGRLVGLTPSNKSADGEYIGTYTRAISLMEFREDVFHVFEELERGRSGGGRNAV